MAEALVIAGFLFLLIVIQLREQRKLKFVAKSNRVKKTISVILSLALLIIFWSNNLADQIKLIAFAVLILLFGFMKEGFSEDHLVKPGILEGDFHSFKTIQIEELPNQSQFVSFYKNKNNRLSLIFNSSQEELIAYFEQNNLKDRLVIEEADSNEEAEE